MKIVINHEPVPQLRPRATGMGKGIRMYDPKKVADYKRLVEYEAKKQWAGDVLTSPLHVTITIYRPIPKSETIKRKELMESQEILPVVRPDIDNYAKAPLDALNGIVWQDDSQIVRLVSEKFYSHEPRTEITGNEV